MAELYRLHNQIKNYNWGSRVYIQDFLGQAQGAIPMAEMWMGTHPGGPSRIKAAGKEMELSSVAGGRLPFLFKLLAAEKPLSIQAHPDPAQAREGFARENAAGIALDDPKRNYKDSCHKPEIICALAPLQVMAGFKKPEDILASFEEFLAVAPECKETLETAMRALERGNLKEFFLRILTTKRTYGMYTNSSCEPGAGRDFELARELAEMYPGDAGALSPLFLHVFTLEKGQAVFIPAGILHAYISGFGVELMAASDNVLRGGLTTKYVDIPALAEILQFSPFDVEIITPDSAPVFRYPAPCDNFALYLVRGGGEELIFPEKSAKKIPPVICIVTEGEVLIDGAVFKKGESFFYPGGEALRFRGNFSLYAAAGRSV
ncbi:MAG: mannose-6-phosphate isomerase, class I [Treponema sp.]|jgi:mannose-6-phosphate isomerase|nr:mannose-6-phosphate isomerase, class I [Treponema sp.]